MAFFKFRKGGEDARTNPDASQSVQAMRTRARHRLIGASVLVLAGVIGFPLLFDNQPRPIAVDIPIEIPDKNKVKPLGNLPVAPAPAQSGGVIGETAPPPLTTATPAATPAPVEKSLPAVAAAKEEIIAAAKPASKPEVKPESKPKPKLEAKVDPKPAAATPTPAAEAAKAKALLEGKEPAKLETTAAPKPEAKADAGKGRFVVQVGSFTDITKAREARLKMEKAGFKTYTQEVQLKEGKRLRVRIGPFETRTLAEKAADKAKKLELSGAILEL